MQKTVRRMMMTVAVMAAAMPAAVQGQVAAFTGEWQLTFGEWQAAGGGEVQIPGGNEATLRVRAQGDSVAATYVTEGGPAPLEMTGSVREGKLVVKGTREARRNINGVVSTVMLEIEIELTRAGDGVSGRITMGSGDDEVVWRVARGTKKAG